MWGSEKAGSGLWLRKHCHSTVFKRTAVLAQTFRVTSDVMSCLFQGVCFWLSEPCGGYERERCVGATTEAQITVRSPCGDQITAGRPYGGGLWCNRRVDSCCRTKMFLQVASLGAIGATPLVQVRSRRESRFEHAHGRHTQLATEMLNPGSALLALPQAAYQSDGLTVPWHVRAIHLGQNRRIFGRVSA